MGLNTNTAPIPTRIPPLTWRQPVMLWTPVALALALGWPPLLLREETGLSLTTLFAGAAVFALSLLSMGGAWMFGRAPRTRRDIVVHVLGAGFLVAIAAPFVLSSVLNAVAEAEHTTTGLRPAAPYALLPLAVLLGLPIAFFYGLTFSFVALVKRPRERDAPRARASKRAVAVRREDVQPFV